MLNQLIKHEIKTTGRMMGIIYSIFAVSTLLVSAWCWILHFNQIDVSQAFFSAPLILYGFTVFILIAASFIYLCYQFYQTMYAQQGYLTHTLPVKTSAILHIKIIVSTGFLFLACAACMVSIAVVVWASTGEGFSFITMNVEQIVIEMAQMLQIPKASVYACLVVGLVLSCITSLLLFFAGSSIGQMFHRSKGMAGILAGIVLYYVSQIISLLFVGSGYLIFHSLHLIGDARWAFVGGFFLLILWTVIYYLINRVIVKKHLNLA